MRSRLVVVSSFLIAGWIGACGSDDNATGVIPTGDDGGNDVTIGNGDTAGDSSSSSDALGSDAFAPVACDMASATRCAPRKCDSTLGCVQCAADTDCPGPDKFCIRGSCEACRTNADCGVAAPVCSPVDNRCHLSCIGDAAINCAGNTPLCDSATGACVGCLTNANCPATAPLCEPSTKTCVQCTTDSQCPAAKPRCFLGDFVCVECATTADCTGGKVCDPGERRCVIVCANDTQCAATPATPKCDTATGSCVQCLTKPDCSAVPNAPLCDTTRGDRCVQCISASDCNADAGTPICDKSRCVQCKSNKDCPGPNPNCDNGTCR